MFQDTQPKKYDPVKAHAYYERTKQLKGRHAHVVIHPQTTSRPKVSPSKSSSHGPVKNQPEIQKTQARIGRLRSKIKILQNALAEVENALSLKRKKSAPAKKADGKTTVQERQASQRYRDKHQQQLKAKAKQKAGGSSNSSSKSVSDMSVQELGARAIKIRRALRDAKTQLSSASQELGQLAHSAIATEPNIDEHFAHFLISRKDSV